jgi:glycosyltransferase involved in cell wall biosynthesis
MKILEAGMIGVPVVTTAVGVEGIPLVDGENCFIANTADAFVQSILKLSEQTLREHFIVSAQKVIAKNYSLEALIKNREHLYQ